MSLFIQYRFTFGSIQHQTDRKTDDPYIYTPLHLRHTHRLCVVCRIASFFRYNIRTSHRPSLFSLARIFPFWVSRACINKTSVFPMVQPQSGSRSADHFRYNSQPVKPSHTTQKKKKEKKYRMNKKETWFTKERGGWNLIFFKAPDGSNSSRPACPVWWSVYIVPLIFIIPPYSFLFFFFFSNAARHRGQQK